MTRSLSVGALARHRPVLLLAGTALAALLDWRWLAGPRCADVADARLRLAALRSELDAARREAATRAETKRAVRAAEHALRRAVARLPDQREVAELLATVAERARGAGLELMALRPKPERAAGDHVEAPVELELRGTFPETLAFLRRLEALGRLVRIGDLRVDRPERVGDRVVVQVRCTARTYRLRGDGERSPGQAPPGGTPP
jgi:type IV pilus assembly protein PilO